MTRFKAWLLNLLDYEPQDALIEDMRAQLADMSLQKQVLEDRINQILEDRGNLWKLLQETIQGERAAYQAHINQAWQRNGFGVPYPEAPHIPPSAVPGRQPSGTMGHGRVLPSQLVNEASVKAINDYYGANK